jgi:hypothetical protein
MTTVQYKAGNYQIGASATQEFTFWWEPGDGPEYFDVSIAPIVNDKYPPQRLPLIEVQRGYILDTSVYPYGKMVLLLTLRNDNDFPVGFIANHVRIYDY